LFQVGVISGNVGNNFRYLLTIDFIYSYYFVYICSFISFIIFCPLYQFTAGDIDIN